MSSKEEKIKDIILKGQINSKKDFYLLYNKGLFGNRPLCWDTYEELLKSSWRNPVCIRSTKGTARSNTRFDVPFLELEKELEDLRNKGVKNNEMSFNQSMPNDKILIQAEIKRTSKGLYLLYSTVKKPMNLAFKEEIKHAFGLEALLILETYLYPQSYSDIMNLFEMFPESVIEFGTYSVYVGDLPGRNTIIWEVRNY